jgi:hypothetical protein
MAEFAVITNKYGRWRARVEELLSTRWDRARLDTQELAATIVGMFDAGADDAEVASLLLNRERAESGAPWLTDEARLALVHMLHASGPRSREE